MLSRKDLKMKLVYNVATQTTNKGTPSSSIIRELGIKVYYWQHLYIYKPLFLLKCIKFMKEDNNKRSNL